MFMSAQLVALVAVRRTTYISLHTALQSRLATRLPLGIFCNSPHTDCIHVRSSYEMCKLLYLTSYMSRLRSCCHTVQRSSGALGPYFQRRRPLWPLVGGAPKYMLLRSAFDSMQSTRSKKR